MKRYRGKAIYQPSGKAAEYSPWACNFYTGCSNDCEYCYCKLGRMSRIWSYEPKLKKCFKSQEHALEVFQRELWINRIELAEHGLLFSFTTDPLLPQTMPLTYTAAIMAQMCEVPVQILTKRADFTTDLGMLCLDRELTAFGFTLTGFDNKEPGASTNQERIEAMSKLHDMGFKTFASLEPIIDPKKSRKIIEDTRRFCDLYKIGLISGSGKNFYDDTELYNLFLWLRDSAKDQKIYIKDSFLSHFSISRDHLGGNFVNSDFNIFNFVKE